MHRVIALVLCLTLSWRENTSSANEIFRVRTRNEQSPQTGAHYEILLKNPTYHQTQNSSPHLYNFWSSVGNSFQNPIHQFQLVPLNTHYANEHGQNHHGVQKGNFHQGQPKRHDSQHGNFGNPQIGQTKYSAKSDHDTIVIQSDQAVENPISVVQDSKLRTRNFKHSTPRIIGFQRGQVEAIPRPMNLEYSQKILIPKLSHGFSRAHVEHRPVGNLALTKMASLSEPVGFNRAAVEALPYGLTDSIPMLKTTTDAKVICYFANWAWYRKGTAHYEPEDIDPTLCTHLIYAFATYDPNSFAIKESDPAIDVNQRLIQRVVALKQKKPGLKVLIAVGGWSDSEDDKYSKLANSLSNRRRFARESLKFLRKYGLDGISMDWHFPVCWQSDCSKGPLSDKYAFTELIKDLRSVYSSQGLIVAASLSGYKEVIDSAYDIPRLSEHLEFMNIMTYDYHGSWESRTGHLSPLYEGPPSEDLKPTYNSNFTMEYYVSKGADRSKLIMGIPFYGQSFTLENKFDHSLGSLAEGAGNAGEFTQQPGMLAYYEICKRVKDLGWTVRKDSSGSWGPYAYKGNQWVGYDDTESIRRKARHVTSHGFGGIFVFTLDLDDFNNECCQGDQPLLRTISKELLGVPLKKLKSDCGNQPTAVASSTNPTTITTTTRPMSPTPSGHKPCSYKTKRFSSDCSSYYVCTGGKETLHHCPNGLHWNENIGTCDWPGAAGCQATRPHLPSTTTTPSSIDCSAGEYFTAPACDQYYICSDGIKKLQSCGPGLHWSEEMKLCDWPSKAKCKSQAESHDVTEAFEEKCTDGSFSGSTRSCEIYYMCVHGRRVEFRCQLGLSWNDEKKLCDWPKNVNCKTSAVTLPTTERSTTKTTTSSTTAFTQVSWVTQKPVNPPWSSTSSSSTASTQVSWVTQEPVNPPWSSTSMSSTTTQAPQPTAPEVVSPPTSTLSGDYKLVCYFTNWAWYRPGMGKYTPGDINPDHCTHIVYGFAVLDYEKLIIKPHDTWADLDNKFYEQVVALKRKGKVVTIAIGGWNDSAGDKYSRLVNNAGARRRFIQHVVQFIQKYNFDGLDLDWEYPKCWQVACDKGPDSDKPNFAAFVRELSQAFKPHKLLLSSAVSPSKTVIDAGYDVPTLSRYFDWISVMTYDYHGQWDKKTGHVAPLYFHEEDDFFYFNANYTMNYWIRKGADSRKLVMGVPLYGQSFTLVNPSENGLNAPSSGGGTAGQYTRSSGFLAYYEICNNIQRDGWTVVKDPTGAMGPYAYKGNQWVSYDDVTMVRKKSELIRQLNLGGGMVWALDLDDFRNTCGQGHSPLLSTMRSVLGKSRILSQGITPVKQVQKLEPDDTVSIQPTETFGGAIAPIREENVEHCDEQFRGDDEDCTKYYQCIFGRYVEQQCPSGTVWNKNRCDWPWNSDSTCEGGKPKPKPKPKPTIGTTSAKPQAVTMVPIISPTTKPKVPFTTPHSISNWPPRFTTTPVPTKDPEWCRLNWCSTEKPLPENSHVALDIPSSPYKVVCYFTNWAWYRPGAGKYKPEDIDFNLCTHIAYGFAVLDPTKLVLKPHDSWADIDNRFYKQVVKLRERGVKVVLALGGWNDSLGDKYSRLVNDPNARRRFIRHVVEFIEIWDFDGLDLDWEYPKCWQVDCDKGPDSDKMAFSAFVRELKEVFEPRGLLLSAAVSPNKKVIDQGYDVPTVSRYLDWIAVMTYDYHGQWDKKTGHNAPLYHHPESDIPFYNTNFTINYWIDQGADRKKIVMGMPMYGQSFTLVDRTNTGLNSKTSGGAQAGPFTRSAGFLAYYEICNYVQKKGWTVVQDQYGAIGPYAYKGNQWVSFDDNAQIRKKSEYIKQMGLGGGMIWALDLDDFRGNCGCEKHPLLKTINRVLRNYPVPDPECKLKTSFKS